MKIKDLMAELTKYDPETDVFCPVGRWLSTENGIKVYTLNTKTGEVLVMHSDCMNKIEEL